MRCCGIVGWQHKPLVSLPAKDGPPACGPFFIQALNGQQIVVRLEPA
jgi:hypothetical protein